MTSVMQGDAYSIPVTIKSGNGTLITPEIAACVEITVGQFTKRWPGQATFDEKTGEWQFPVTQKQTFRFAPGAAVVQARVVFQDGSIMGGSGAPVRVEQSASRGTLPQPEKAEAATGSAPKATEVTIPTVHDIDVSLHSQVILSDPIKAPYIGDNGNWYEYDAATGTFVDTGTSASGTPPITPDTAGKYLTNDGSKAEWGEVEESVKVGDAKDGDLLKLGGSDVLNAAAPNVDYALPILYVTITQDGQDSDGNPIYKSDKTYEEINAAWHAGQDVKIANDGVFYANFSSFLGIQEIPLLYVQSSAYFAARGVPKANAYDAQSYMVGGQPIATVEVFISYKGEVRVNLPVNMSTEEWVEVNKLPQQYIINVTEGTGGTLTADWTYEEIQKTIDAYNDGKSGTAVFVVKFDKELYAVSKTFIDSNSNTLQEFDFTNLSDTKKRLSLNNNNYWTASIRPFTAKYFFLNQHNAGDYYLSDEDGNKVFPRDVSNLYGLIQYIYYQGFEYTLLNIQGPYIDFLAVNRDKYAIISVDIAASYGQGTVTWSGWKPICPNQTPKVTTADNGKFLRVVDGQWAAEAVANAKGVSF